MIQAVDLRSGMTYMDEDNLMRVIEANHHKPGKGNTVMRMKIQNIRTGAITETTYRPDARFPRAYLETRDVQYLYQDGGNAIFMDLETYEQYELSVDLIENELQYILENQEVKIQFHSSEVIGVELPNSVVLTVKETEPHIKGATVTGSGKPATMETGLVVNVPDFIEVGEKLVINTSDGSYQGRSKD